MTLIKKTNKNTPPKKIPICKVAMLFDSLVISQKDINIILNTIRNKDWTLEEKLCCIQILRSGILQSITKIFKLNYPKNNCDY